MTNWLVDTNHWLSWNGFHVEGPRTTSTPERLEPGDVAPTGLILTQDGSFMEHGGVYVNRRQLSAAAYYGWRLVGRIRVQGDLLYLVER